MSGTDRLQDFRLRRGITQEEVAEELIRLAAADGLEVKVDGSVISKWERGKKRPRRHYRRLLCRFYQATEEDLGLKALNGTEDFFDPRRVVSRALTAGTQCRDAGDISPITTFEAKRFDYLLSFPKVDIFIPSRDVGRLSPVIALEDQESASGISEMLGRHGFQCQIIYIPPDGSFAVAADRATIVICGPKNSPIVEEAFLRQPYLQLLERDGVWMFLERMTGNRIFSPMDNNHPEDGDLAFFGKVILPRFPETPVLLICGIHALGSRGAAFFMDDKAKMANLLKLVGQNNFCCLVRSRVEAHARALVDCDIFLHPKVIK